MASQSFAISSAAAPGAPAHRRTREYTFMFALVLAVALVLPTSSSSRRSRTQPGAGRTRDARAVRARRDGQHARDPGRRWRHRPVGRAADGPVNIVLVTGCLARTRQPLIAIPILLVLGGLIGAVNGVLVGIVRYPPVIATLGVYFILGGINLRLAPDPVRRPELDEPARLESLAHPGRGVHRRDGAALLVLLPPHRPLRCAVRGRR